MNWIDEAINNYYRWMKERTTYHLDDSTQWAEINTPFIGLFNDCIDVYIKKEGNKYLLSDDGETLEKLSLLGINLSKNSKRKQWGESILRNHGITLEGTELTTEASLENLPMKKHSLVSAIIELSEMESLTKSSVDTFFTEDVRAFLDQSETIYTPNFITKGSTGIEFTFDFQIAGKDKEKVIKSFNTLNKSNVPSFLFAWEDIRVERQKTSRKELGGLAFINDSERPVKEEFLNALTIKGADYILWSQRNTPQSKRKLVA